MLFACCLCAQVLSVVAQQVMEIQLAVKAKLRTFTFEASELRLRPSCNVFITMNPGYAGAAVQLAHHSLLSGQNLACAPVHSAPLGLVQAVLV
jgi:hypothetical protein